MGGDRLKGHFVNTSFASGLTDRAAERMIAVLNGDHEQGMGAFALRAVRYARAQVPDDARPRPRGRPSPPPASSRATLPQPHRPVAAKEASGQPPRQAARILQWVAHRRQRRASGRWAARCATRRTHATRPWRRASGAQSPTSAKARTAAFGAAQPGLHSPTCARASMSSGLHPPPSSSSSADAPAASG